LNSYDESYDVVDKDYVWFFNNTNPTLYSTGRSYNDLLSQLISSDI